MGFDVLTVLERMDVAGKVYGDMDVKFILRINGSVTSEVFNGGVELEEIGGELSAVIFNSSSNPNQLRMSDLVERMATAVAGLKDDGDGIPLIIRSCKLLGYIFDTCSSAYVDEEEDGSKVFILEFVY